MLTAVIDSLCCRAGLLPGGGGATVPSADPRVPGATASVRTSAGDGRPAGPREALQGERDPTHTHA